MCIIETEKYTFILPDHIANYSHASFFKEMKVKLKGHLQSESIRKHIMTAKMKISKEIQLEIKLFIFNRNKQVNFETF